jgi:hypothetical protein
MFPYTAEESIVVNPQFNALTYEERNSVSSLCNAKYSLKMAINVL